MVWKNQLLEQSLIHQIKQSGKATAAKISPEVTTKAGVSTHKEDVDRAKDDSIEGPATGKKHKCPTHVKKEGYGYGKNISHTLSDNVVDKMNIYWYDSKEVSYMMPTSEVEIVSEGYHDETNHTEKFKSTKKIAEELSKLSNPFELSSATYVDKWQILGNGNNLSPYAWTKKERNNV